jgi:hypothetical protein
MAKHLKGQPLRYRHFTYISKHHWSQGSVSVALKTDFDTEVSLKSNPSITFSEWMKLIIEN